MDEKEDRWDKALKSKRQEEMIRRRINIIIHMNLHHIQCWSVWQIQD